MHFPKRFKVLPFSLVLFSLSFLCFSLLGLSTNSSEVTDHCATLTGATELETVCAPGATSTCVLDSSKTYKVSSSVSTKASPLPPINTKGATLCITNGTLNETSVTLYTQSIWVNGGIFQIGSPDSPISAKNKVTIVMTGASSAAKDKAPQPICVTDKNISCSTIATKSKNTPNARDITVTGGGKLLFYGAKGLTKNSNGKYKHDLLNGKTFADCYNLETDGNHHSTGGCTTDSGVKTYNLDLDPYFNKLTGSNSWTYLAMPAGLGYYSKENWVQAPVDYTKLKVYTDSTLTTEKTLPNSEYLLVLSKDVTSDSDTGWQKGDWISVSTTGFSSHQTEIVQICDIFYAKNPERNTTVYPGLTKDPFYKESTPDYSKYATALGLKDAVSVLQLAGNGCTVGAYSNTTDTGTPLKHYHFGSLMPTPGFFSTAPSSYTNSDSTKYTNVQSGQAYSMYDGSLRNFGIDERAEVALLSRNIRLTSTAGDGSTSNSNYPNSQYFGGHIAVMNMGSGAPTEHVELVGVEIEKFGQPLVGRYPIHFHRLNSNNIQEDADLLVQDVSVHHSYNKCFVPHSTLGVKFYNNVCVRAIGQGFYLEDGYRVIDNHFVRNLVAGVMGASLDYTPYNKTNPSNLPSPGSGKNLFWSGDYLTNDNGLFGGYGYDPSKIPDTSNSGANTGYPIDSINPNGFWITNFGNQLTPNLFINNSVAGCQLQGRAYWLVRQDVKTKKNGVFPKQTTYPIFKGNRGHGCYAGLDTDARMALGVNNSTTTAPYPVPPNAAVNGDANAPVVIFNDLTFTRIRYKAFWTRSLFSSILNSRFAANKQGVTILGGGGPEGNVLGFWGLVKNNVFAGITNNNVDRYYDCEQHMKTQGANVGFLGVLSYNEASECVDFNSNPVKGNDATLLTNQSIANSIIVLAGEGSAINGNLQGYTFYDGPARMEYTRFVNFRVDATDKKNIDNSETRYLSTKVDSGKMLNMNNNIAQFGVVLNPTPPKLQGGVNHYGYEGDPAMAWIKGNSQALPPTQYALGNIWENTNFKHQVFTETVNMNNGISDGDKQTIILDKDSTLSGYKVCNGSGCNDAINHYPISLNNLAFYATPYTVDEPDAIGRNNVIASALMSPHKYATINIETSPIETVAAAPKLGAIGNNNFNLKIVRDMTVYNGQESSIYLYGRGGKPIFETFFMNNMGYTVYPQNNAAHAGFEANLLFSYSDAPPDSLFINRIGVCLGTNVSKSDIHVGRVLRQWGHDTNYLAPSPYLSNMQNASNCAAIFNGSATWTWTICNNNATQLGSSDSLKKINKEFLTLSTLSPGDTVNQKYYFDKTTGILYFNMVQLGDPSTVSTITPPYSVCDSTTYNSAIPTYTAYKMFSNDVSIGTSLETACFFPNNATATQAPQNSTVINCPREGCVSYTVATGKEGNGQCTAPNTMATIVAPSKVDTSKTVVTKDHDHRLVYASPYWLQRTLPGSLIQPTVTKPTLGQIAVSNYPTSSGGSTTKNFYFYCDRNIVSPSSGTGFLPLSTLNCGTDNSANLLSPLMENPIEWNLVTGAGVSVTISGATFINPAPTYSLVTSYTIPPVLPKGFFYIKGPYPHYLTLTITAGGTTYTCDKVKFKPKGSINDSKCSKSFRDYKKNNITVSGSNPVTITINPPSP